MADREDRRRSQPALVCDRLDVVPVTRLRAVHRTATGSRRNASRTTGDCDENVCAHCKRKIHSVCASSHSVWRYRGERKDVLSKLPTFYSASLLRSSSLCLRRGRRRSFTGPISAHHDGLRGTPSTSTLGLALGRACRLRVEAPLRASLAATHALLAIASERSGAERPVPTLIVVHDPRSRCEGSQGAVHPARCLAGPGLEQQYVQLTRTPNL